MISKHVLVVLAITVASVLTLWYALATFSRIKPLMSWEDALELRRALSTGRVSLSTTLHVKELPLTLNVTLDGRAYAVPASRVLIYFEARSAPGDFSQPFEEALPLLWRGWGNGSHAGAVSFFEFSDNGATVLVKYLSLSRSLRATGRGSSFCISQVAWQECFVASREEGSVSAHGYTYSWTGRRTVKIVRAEVGPCGG